MNWRDATFVVWAVLAVLAVGCEWWARRSSGTVPTAGDVAAVVMRSRVGRTVVLLGWMWLGWHAFAR
jgi:hypothetical protein